MKIANKIGLIASLLTLSLPSLTLAQDNHFENGMAAYEKKDYETALVSFSAALEDKYLMKGRDVPRAYNFRAKSVAEYFDLMLKDNNSDFISENPNILVNAFEDLDQAIRFDDGRCNAIIADTKSQLLDVTFQFGKTIADSLRVDRGSNDPRTDSLIVLVIDELQILKKLSGESYEINDLLGLLQYKEGNIEEAINSFTESERIYQATPPLTADYNHVYNYYYSALINYLELHEFDNALEDVKKARKFISQYFDGNEEAKAFDAKLEALEFQVKLLKN
ncbi:MAG: hypothetical protein ABJF11_15040 [Reichenbachiella sp.]|uniref:hypothetical protein n=1 Tax=Reichenbachiella sp. TaxID=2184521 RepID=UPI0032641BF7